MKAFNKTKELFNKALFSQCEQLYQEIFIENFIFDAVCACLTNPLSANPTIWSNTLKQLVGKLPTNCVIVFDHFVGFAVPWS